MYGWVSFRWPTDVFTTWSLDHPPLVACPERKHNSLHTTKAWDVHIKTVQPQPAEDWENDAKMKKHVCFSCGFWVQTNLGISEANLLLTSFIQQRLQLNSWNVLSLAKMAIETESEMGKFNQIVSNSFWIFWLGSR